MWGGQDRRNCNGNSNIAVLRELTNRLNGISHPLTPATRNYDTDQGTVISFGLFKEKDIGVINFYSSAGAVLKEHFHDMNEWIAIYKGEAVINIDGESFSVKQHEVFNIKPGLVHTFTTPAETWGIAITMPADGGYPDGSRT